MSFEEKELFIFLFFLLLPGIGNVKLLSFSPLLVCVYINVCAITFQLYQVKSSSSLMPTTRSRNTTTITTFTFLILLLRSFFFPLLNFWKRNYNIKETYDDCTCVSFFYLSFSNGKGFLRNLRIETQSILYISTFTIIIIIYIPSAIPF